MIVRNRLAVRGWLAFVVLTLSARIPVTAQDTASVAVPAEPRTTVLTVVGDLTTGDPVVGAFVRIDGELAGITDETGRFQVQLEPGLHRMDVRRIGYEGRTLEFQLEAKPLVQLAVALDAIPYELPEIVVTGQRTRLVFGPLREFYRRMNEGMGGHYITRDEIERRVPRAVSDLLRSVPGVEVNQVGIDPAQVRMFASRGSCSEPLLFLNGIAVDAPSPDVLIDPAQVEALEVYTRPLNVPPEFASQGSTCGVIAIWSR